MASKTKKTKTMAAKRGGNRSRPVQTPRVAPSRMAELPSNQDLLMKIGQHVREARVLVEGRAAQTAAAKRLTHRTQHLIAELDAAGPSSDLSILGECVQSHVTSNLHVEQQAEYHLHEAERALSTLESRMPLDVLAARSRRPGRR